MNVSITVFIISTLSSIDKYYLQFFFFFSLLFYFYYRFSYTQIWYYLISDTVLNWHFNDLKQYSCPRLFTFGCRCCHSFHFLFVPDINYIFIFIFKLTINDIDVHFHIQFHCCCYCYLSCCLLEMDR